MSKNWSSAKLLCSPRDMHVQTKCFPSQTNFFCWISLKGFSKTKKANCYCVKTWLILEGLVRSDGSKTVAAGLYCCWMEQFFLCRTQYAFAFFMPRSRTCETESKRRTFRLLVIFLWFIMVTAWEYDLCKWTFANHCCYRLNCIKLDISLCFTFNGH